METGVTKNINSTQRNKIKARIISVLVIGMLLGYWFHIDSIKDYEKGKELTLEQYTEGFEDYKNKLISGKHSLWAGLIAGPIVLLLLIGPYEILSFIITGFSKKMSVKNSDTISYDKMY